MHSGVQRTLVENQAETTEQTQQLRHTLIGYQTECQIVCTTLAGNVLTLSPFDIDTRVQRSNKWHRIMSSCSCQGNNVYQVPGIRTSTYYCYIYTLSSSYLVYRISFLHEAIQKKTCTRSTRSKCQAQLANIWVSRNPRSGSCCFLVY